MICPVCRTPLHKIEDFFVYGCEGPKQHTVSPFELDREVLVDLSWGKTGYTGTRTYGELNADGTTTHGERWEPIKYYR